MVVTKHPWRDHLTYRYGSQTPWSYGPTVFSINQNIMAFGAYDKGSSHFKVPARKIIKEKKRTVKEVFLSKPFSIDTFFQLYPLNVHYSVELSLKNPTDEL